LSWLSIGKSYAPLPNYLFADESRKRYPLLMKNRARTAHG